jgi:DNA-binding CsgD family transcriptional regulator/tetratricopeptide (TPR) repeat protein
MTSGASKPTPVLVGRQHELDSLWNQFEQSMTGRLHVALVAGEPGIGKTRLLGEIARRAEQTGALVLRGGASEAEGMPPYLSFLEALGQHIRSATPDELREQTGAMASVLATILPELSLCLGELPSSYVLPPEQARLRLYEAVGTFLAAIAAPHGLLLLLDDLQWADTATLDLLCYVAHAQPNARLLVLGAYRAGEVTHRPAFERALTELNRLRLLTSIKIGPLTETDLRTFATNTLDTPIDAAFSRLLATQSEGNPFFAEELLWGWLETGVISYDERGVRLGEPVEAALPSSIVGAVRQRVNRLASRVITLLHTAAIIGRTFDIALLAEVVDQDRESVEEHLQQAEQARLIRSEQAGTFTFSHDTIRACLYDEMSSARRTRLHTLIGRSLELRLDHSDAHQLAELAFHFARSGDRELGATYSQLAAEQARSAYAPQEAVGHYRTALVLVADNDLRRGEWLQGLGEAALLAAAPQDAIGAFQAAQDWWLRAGNSAAAGRAALGLGRAHWQLEEIGLSRAALQKAVTLLSEPPGTDTARALIELGSLLVLSLHEYTEARGYLDQALTLTQKFGDMHLEAAASRAMGNLLLRAGDVEGATLMLEQALLKADEVSDALEATESSASLYMAYNWAGVLDQREVVLQRWLAYARRCHDPYQLRHIYSHLAFHFTMRGQRAEAEEALAQGQLIVEQLASPEPLALLQLMQGMIAGVLWGDLETSEELLCAAIARFRALEPRSLVWWLGGLGFVQALEGKRQEALAALDELEALIAPLSAEAMPTAHTLSNMAAITVQLGDQKWAARLYPRLLPFHGQFHSFLVDRLLGALAILLEDYATARGYLATAEEATQRFGLKVEYASTLLAEADLELAERGRSGVATARTFLEEAATLVEQFGNQDHPWARQIRERLRQLARMGTRPHLPAGLSLREAEVLRLVAQGLSNREIAGALVISERTVANHLVSIYNKTLADNRAAATAFAFRYGLAE